MDQWPPDIAAVHDRQDVYRAASNPPRPETALRADLRSWVRELLKYTERGRRGAGLTNPSILRDAYYARHAHTQSIRRDTR